MFFHFFNIFFFFFCMRLLVEGTHDLRFDSIQRRLGSSYALEPATFSDSIINYRKKGGWDSMPHTAVRYQIMAEMGLGDGQS